MPTATNMEDRGPRTSTGSAFTEQKLMIQAKDGNGKIKTFNVEVDDDIALPERDGTVQVPANLRISCAASSSVANFVQNATQDKKAGDDVTLKKEQLDALVRNITRKEETGQKYKKMLVVALVLVTVFAVVSFVTSWQAVELGKEVKTKEGGVLQTPSGEDVLVGSSDLKVCGSEGKLCTRGEEAKTLVTKSAERKEDIWMTKAMDSESLARIDYVTLPMDRAGSQEATYHIASAIKQVDGVTLLTSDGSRIRIDPGSWRVTITPPYRGENLTMDPIEIQYDVNEEGKPQGTFSAVLHMLGTDEISYGEVTPNYDHVVLPSDGCLAVFRAQYESCAVDVDTTCQCMENKKSALVAACDGNLKSLGPYNDLMSTCSKIKAGTSRRLSWGNIPEKSRRLLMNSSQEEARRLVVDYGWCSTNLGFVTTLASDSSNYCDPGQTCDSHIGCGGSVSECCIVHDKCLQVGTSTTRCPATNCQGKSCDENLARCAWGVSCGWDMGCRTYQLIIKGIMGGFTPQAGHNSGGANTDGVCHDRRRRRRNRRRGWR